MSPCDHVIADKSMGVHFGIESSYLAWDESDTIKERKKRVKMQIKKNKLLFVWMYMTDADKR